MFPLKCCDGSFHAEVCVWKCSTSFREWLWCWLLSTCCPARLPPPPHHHHEAAPAPLCSGSLPSVAAGFGSQFQGIRGVERQRGPRLSLPRLLPCLADCSRAVVPLGYPASQLPLQLLGPKLLESLGTWLPLTVASLWMPHLILSVA